MWWLANPQDLHRVSDRLSTIYIERCHVDRADNAIVLVNRERTIRVPAAMIASVLLGPGTRITHAAAALLADSGTTICWVGEHGVRLYASGLGPSRGAALIHRQAYLVTRAPHRLAVARAMYAKRFPGEDVSGLNMQQLRGREGARVKKIYRQHSVRTKVPWQGREYKPGQPFEAGDDINRLLSAGHACLYAICHAAIVGIGASPALGFVHTGGATSFVLDIADLYKAEYTIPLAFDLAAAGHTDERKIRLAFRDKVADGKLMAQVVKDIKELLLDGSDNATEEDANLLWDERAGAVPGGINWAGDYADDFDDDAYIGVSGPEIDESQQVDW
ncbi:type I-E CRISPR-associated endonuclease Cas1e [Actinoplanes siamensis]|uniref:CRISPR-associated endonuclease Cas1 n=1 Tax=Actinoplanes siamensis TaxID=1223317 RepID=A0A919TJH7_9ACTN|nr:type I-E CRISPR-associated endonuclease Cas1e [Actinoplanes siamensis]GIF04420.1 CRISPR-associated endonuclease Cas1 [Actinoplanes siamensis]